MLNPMTQRETEYVRWKFILQVLRPIFSWKVRYLRKWEKKKRKSKSYSKRSNENSLSSFRVSFDSILKEKLMKWKKCGKPETETWETIVQPQPKTRVTILNTQSIATKTQVYSINLLSAPDQKSQTPALDLIPKSSKLKRWALSLKTSAI